jgi:hypothetical protein
VKVSVVVVLSEVMVAVTVGSSIVPLPLEGCAGTHVLSFSNNVLAKDSASLTSMRLCMPMCMIGITIHAETVVIP